MSTVTPARDPSSETDTAQDTGDTRDSTETEDTSDSDPGTTGDPSEDCHASVAGWPPGQAEAEIHRVLAPGGSLQPHATHAGDPSCGDRPRA